jgi:hypothetical protein
LLLSKLYEKDFITGTFTRLIESKVRQIAMLPKVVDDGSDAAFHLAAR